MLSYEDSYSKGGDGGSSDFSLSNLDGGVSLDSLGGGGHGGGGYGDSGGGGHGGGGGGGYDYTPNQNFEQHDDHHDHHPEPPKGHWEKKMKWKEEWVKEIKTVKKQSHETKWKSVSVPVWQEVESMRPIINWLTFWCK